MKKDDFDIPEVFRRAMEEAGWQESQSGGGERPPRARRSSNAQRSHPWRLGLLIFLVFLALAALGSLATFYTDILWFTQLGYRSLFFKRWVVSAAVFIVAFTIAAIIFAGNGLLAWRRSQDIAAGTQPRFGVWLNFVTRNGIIAGALLMSALFAFALSGQWNEILLFFNGQSFGLPDPIFGRDVSFYMFRLPVYRLAQGWLLMILFVALVATWFIYLAPQLGNLKREAIGRLIRVSAMMQHLAVLGGLLLLVWSVSYALNIYDLLYSPTGITFGAGYTDIHALLWAYRLQMATLILAGLALLLQAFRPSVRLPLIAAALWLAVTVIAGGIVPAVMQRYSVEPNELVLEAPYIRHNIAFTRNAFGLDRIRIENFGQVDDLRPEDLLENDAVLDNIRLWDWRPLQQTYRQVQGLRPYYEFSDVDIDRYTINGRQRQVMLGGRELDKSKLPAPSWVNRNLEFTHGYGLVMNPVNEVTPDGQPRFFIKDFPPRSNVAIQVTRPEIYYGELTADTVYVSSGREEFDYPSGTENVYSHYEGRGGVALDSFFKRLAFALRQSDPNILLSNDITNTTRVQYRRQVQDRIESLTPFLVLDSDPYLVINDEGRLIWLQDAYTVSDDFPYSTPANMTVGATLSQNGNAVTRRRTHTLNYIRNSVKVTVDAYDGTVNYYVFDEDDPIIRTYERIFPGVFRPRSEMPADLLPHIRYPEDLFTVQARQFLTYHMTDVRVFYNKEDLWQIPTEISGDNEVYVEPYFVMLPLPGGDEQEFLLILPFSPSTKNNMIGWMAARNDPGVYGELIVYELPKQELIFGPIQVEGRIDQEPGISEQFSLWNQLGSGVVRGNLLVLPINQSFLYIEPIYLRSETSALPELKRIVTASNTSVAMAETLDRSLAILAGMSAAPGTTPNIEGVPNIPTAPIIGDQSIRELVTTANEHLAAAEAAQRQGDWARYGEELQALQTVLQQLSLLLEESGN